LATGASVAPSPNPGTDPAVQIAERRVIQNASLTLRVEDVRPATESVRRIAEALGGFVEQLSLSGSADDADGFVVIRVPQGEFFTAIERVSALGEVLGENVSSQDVTAQFVDLEAQLRSLTREEGRLLDLLERANTVSEILVVEGELIRIRTQIERLQGSLNFLERRVALATITVSIIPPRGFVTEPPTAVLSIEVGRVQRAQDEVKDLAERLDGVVERSTLRVIDDEAVATVRIRVPRDVFLQAVDSIEDLGDVRQKTLEEGGQSRFLDLPAGVVIEEPDEPDALIDVRLASDGGSDTALWASLGGSLGGVALLLAIGLTIWRLRRRPAP
jgi:Tfp pilus assembly protein PilN